MPPFSKPFYRWRPHPWHGLEIGPDAPRLVNAFIEISPHDLMKYEVDKTTGYLRIDRPQRSSSQHPSLYGFIPRTYCGEQVGNLMQDAKRGDGDPLDICVISERPISKTEILLHAKVVGGLPMLDHDEADDKIIAILKDDPLWADADEITDLPDSLIERLRHYFMTYKLVPGEENRISIGPAYGFAHASEVISAAIADYETEFGGE